MRKFRFLSCLLVLIFILSSTFSVYAASLGVIRNVSKSTLNCNFTVYNKDNKKITTAKYNTGVVAVSGDLNVYYDDSGAWRSNPKYVAKSGLNILRYKVIPKSSLGKIKVESNADSNGWTSNHKRIRQVCAATSQQNVAKMVFTVNANYYNGPLNTWDAKCQIIGIEKVNGVLHKGAQTAGGPSDLGGWIGFDKNFNAYYGTYDQVNNKVISGANPTSASIVNAVGGGVIIVKDGNIAITDSVGRCAGGPKTVIGTKSNGDIVLISTQGRVSGFYSMTPIQLAQTAKALGCTNAIVLDGGGSTSFSFGYNGAAHEMAKNGGEATSRAVANGISFIMK